MAASAAQVREQMVSHQLRTWEVLDDRILDAVRALPREVFVPAAWQAAAYGDFEIPLARGQHMLAPKVAGRILQSLGLRPGEKVLEIGTGSGYLTACFAQLGGEVTSYEIHEELADRARAHLAAAGFAGDSGPRVIAGDGLEAAGTLTTRFDAIALTGSLPLYDPRFEALLAPGGRLFAVVGEGPAMDARLITRADGGTRQQSLFETRLDPLLNAPRTEVFRF